MENRKYSDKLTIRCSKEEAEMIRKKSNILNKTYRELLILPHNEVEGQKRYIRLDRISNQCEIIQEKFVDEIDKKIFREGMKEVWRELLKI